jgi:5-methylcytosine-specific restriction enzyme A
MPIPSREKIKQDLVLILKQSGAMTTTAVYSHLANLWNLTQEERELVRSGSFLYQHEIRWARQELVIEGVISRPSISGRAIWKLTQDVRVPPNEYENRENNRTYTEGKSIQVLVNVYERSTGARQECLNHHGYSCKICGFNFELFYGNIGKECIHVHHLIELNSIGSEYQIDPVKDLIPLCANCHYIIHRRRPAFSIGEIKALLSNQ